MYSYKYLIPCSNIGQDEPRFIYRYSILKAAQNHNEAVDTVIDLLTSQLSLAMQFSILKELQNKQSNANNYSVLRSRGHTRLNCVAAATLLEHSL